MANNKTIPYLYNEHDLYWGGKRVFALHILRAKADTFAQFMALPKDEQKQPIHICVACNHKVAWVKSKRTGKSYLCDVTMFDKGRFRYFDPAAPHFKTCTNGGK